MATTFPFSFLQLLVEPVLQRVQPPDWIVSELQQRLVLLINHVLMQEPLAQGRLQHQQGKVASLVWGRFSVAWVVTPAGLLNVAPDPAQPDLRVTLVPTSAVDLARDLTQGKAPPVKIEGDVQLATEVAWLAQNLRWDIEEDLARLVGDAHAHALAEGARKLVQATGAWMGAKDAAPQAPGPGQGRMVP